MTAPGGTTSSVDVPIGPSLGHHSSSEVSRTALEPHTLLTFYSASMLRPAHGADAFALIQYAAGTSAGNARAACDDIVHAFMGEHARAREGGAVLTAVVRTAHPRRLRVLDIAPGPRRCRRLQDASPRAVGSTAVGRSRVRHGAGGQRTGDERADPRRRESAGPPHPGRASHRGGLGRLHHLPHLRHARAQDENGRGLFIAATPATRWGTRYGEEGKTIWVEQDLSPEESSLRAPAR